MHLADEYVLLLGDLPPVIHGILLAVGLLLALRELVGHLDGLIVLLPQLRALDFWEHNRTILIASFLIALKARVPALRAVVRDNTLH